MIGRRGSGPRVARAELVLAREDIHPLLSVGLAPDPLRDLVVAIGSIDHDAGERAEVALDLLPVTAGERRRWSRRAEQRTHAVMGRSGSGAGGVWDQLKAELFKGTGAEQRGQRAVPRSTWDRAEDRKVERKAIGDEPVFWVQVLLRAEAEHRERAAAILQQMLAGFDVFESAENSWSVAGRRVLGRFVGGSDSGSNRRRFDRRFESGLFAPRKRSILTTSELAGLLKPPTATCPASFVRRTAGVIPPPPRRLPEWVPGRSDLIPLGVVSTPDGDRQVAVRAKDSLFAYTAGRSGYGKTNTAIGRFLAFAYSGNGCMFIDPHGDAIVNLKHYLGAVAQRVEEISLESDPNGLQAGWNPISMEGLASHDIEGKVSAVVDSFAAALNWGEINNRALTLTTMTVQSLCELSLQLPAEMSPTLFQMTTMLSDEEWRAAVMPALSASTRDFWEVRFPKLSTDAITPVTNLIDRLRSSPTVAALFGSSRSTYDVRRSMDSGRIVLWSTAGTGALVTLVNCFVTYDLFRAAMSRRKMLEDDRRPFYAFIDELQRISGTGSGSAGESVARMLEEARKMRLFLWLSSQQPTRLAKPTLEAIYTNRSHLMSYTGSADSAKELAKEWGGKIDAAVLTALPEYKFIAQVTLDGQLTAPFLVTGMNAAEMWAHEYDDSTDAVDIAIDETLQRRPVSTILGELDTLNDRIRAHFEQRSPVNTGAIDDLQLGRARPSTGPARCSGAGGTEILTGGTSDALVDDVADEDGALGSPVVVPFKRRGDA